MKKKFNHVEINTPTIKKKESRIQEQYQSIFLQSINGSEIPDISNIPLNPEKREKKRKKILFGGSILNYKV